MFYPESSQECLFLGAVYIQAQWYAISKKAREVTRNKLLMPINCVKDETLYYNDLDQKSD
jgi:hypothetical protein